MSFAVKQSGLNPSSEAQQLVSLSESTFQPARLSVLSGETGTAAPISQSVRIQGTTAEEVPGAMKAFNKVPSSLGGES